MQTNDQKAIKTQPVTVVLILTTALLSVLFGVWILVKCPSSFSENENRALQDHVSLFSWQNGGFSEQVNAYYADQFPLRRAFLTGKAIVELSLGKGENNDVIFAEDGYLIDRLSYTDAQIESVAANLRYASLFAEKAEEAGIPCTLALAPRALDVLESKLPAAFDTARSSSVWTLTESYSGDLVTFRDSLRESAETTRIWFRTDHHWNAFGAEIAYRSLAEVLEFEPLDSTALSFVPLSEDFRGTAYSSACADFVGAEEFGVLRYEGDDRFSVTVIEGNTEKELDGLYDESKLQTKDKYAYYLSGNFARIRITDESAPARETLVIVKDSFANALIPLLADNYNLEIIDPRYFTGSVASIAASVNASRILLLFGIDSLAQGLPCRSLGIGSFTP